MDELVLEKKIIEAKLKGSEWKALKVLLGEWSSDDERYILYLRERKQLRERHQEIENLLKVGN